MVSAATSLDSAILAYLKSDHMLREGHFAYRSGRHSAALLDRDRLLADPQAASRMAYALAKQYFTDKIDTVAAPSIWGAGLAQFIAYFFDPKAKVVYATPLPDGGKKVADNLLGLIQHKRVLLADNVIISGDTLTWFDQEIEKHNGEVIGICTLWNGSTHEEIGGHKVFGLLNALYPSLDPTECPLCAAGEGKPTEVHY
jgi:orotate phosphoribosyltransferase